MKKNRCLMLAVTTVLMGIGCGPAINGTYRLNNFGNGMQQGGAFPVPPVFSFNQPGYGYQQPGAQGQGTLVINQTSSNSYTATLGGGQSGSFSGTVNHSTSATVSSGNVTLNNGGMVPGVNGGMVPGVPCQISGGSFNVSGRNDGSTITGTLTCGMPVNSITFTGTKID